MRAGRDRLRVLLINKGASPVHASLDLPAVGSASLQRLLASSPGARTGMTLAGQQLDEAGRWVGRPTTQVIRRRARRYRVAVPAFSAALLSLHAGRR